MQIKVKKVRSGAKLPEYQTTGAGAFDLPALFGRKVPAGGQAKLDTGLAFEVPEGHVMLIFSRSGHGFNQNLRLSNCVGVIDSDYRGEVRVAVHNDGDKDHFIGDGERIAQGMIVPVPRVEFVEYSELPETARGDSGFGSTDARFVFGGDGERSNPLSLVEISRYASDGNGHGYAGILEWAASAKVGDKFVDWERDTWERIA